MIGGFYYKPKPKWRKGLGWHLKQFYISWKVWKRNKQDAHLDLGTFHCWRINRLYSKHYLDN